LASRPSEALNFSQVGGSSRLESAGVWWCSMPYDERIMYPSFHENIAFIEAKWSKEWGDRMNELVFIGQDLRKEEIIENLESCLLQEEEYSLFVNNYEFNDPFPVEI
jgi:G3E family GTPase